ncbi:hypothetical protein P692DRAFT_201857780 [Suillus brevipes Sb2]|nr:hypothetical protein P692DRAFT_201857780 [Suillus brevipes Sb2]
MCWWMVTPGERDEVGGVEEEQEAYCQWDAVLASPRTTRRSRESVKSHGRSSVKMGTELRSFEQSDEGVTVVLTKNDTLWVIGVGGAEGIVRKQLGLTFLGETRDDVRMVMGNIRLHGVGLDRARLTAPNSFVLLRQDISNIPDIGFSSFQPFPDQQSYVFGGSNGNEGLGLLPICFDWQYISGGMNPMTIPLKAQRCDDDIRSATTNTFASLIKMVPLEAGLPDPTSFPEELLKRRETERQFLTQLLDGSKVEQYTIPVPIKAELRKYQQEGVNWLAFLAKYQLHGILCDDMGLGKTLQSICILAGKHAERAKKYEDTESPDAVHLPSLIVCPPTLTGHWYYEILKYSENLQPILYTGNSKERARLLPKLSKKDVVITSYEVVRNDIASLEDYSWLYCILDEGHVIKNAKTKLTKAVKAINAQHRLILSGTPIQNNVLELWSLFDFLMPGFLGTETSFNERFSKPILSNRDGKAKTGEAAALALEALHKQVLPFLLRRLKEDVLNDLPPKIIQDYYCELSEVQKTLYDDFSGSQAKTNAEDAIQGVVKDAPQQHVFQSLQHLCKLCNHPSLILKTNRDAVIEALAKDRQLLTDCGIGGSPSVTGERGKIDPAESLSESSSAFSQHRALIFCQMKQMLDIIENDLFNIDCLLLITHVGGLGLTLTGADTVIFVEHDWNPMKDLQAMDRAHRIGQKKVVNVYRLIMKGTLEEKIMGRLVDLSLLRRVAINLAHHPTMHAVVQRYSVVYYYSQASSASTDFFANVVGEITHWVTAFFASTMATNALSSGLLAYLDQPTWLEHNVGNHICNSSVKLWRDPIPGGKKGRVASQVKQRTTNVRLWWRLTWFIYKGNSQPL